MAADLEIMASELVVVSDQNWVVGDGSTGFMVPAVIAQAGDATANRFIEFFLVSIRNPNTRAAYGYVAKQFFAWCEVRGLSFDSISAISISAYIEQHPGSPTTRNQHLSGIRRLFEWMKQGGIVEVNPALEVKPVRYKAKIGKTPVLTDEEMRTLLTSIDTSTVVGLRDRALIATMFYSFARISAVLGMKVRDYHQKQKRWWLRLHEKRGRYHEVPAHHKVEEYLDIYIEEGGLQEAKDTPLFRSVRGQSKKLSEKPLTRKAAWVMMKRRALAAGVNPDACNHSCRASGITNFLINGGSRDNAQKIAAHEDVKTTALYDRREDTISLDEIERIRL